MKRLTQLVIFAITAFMLSGCAELAVVTVAGSGYLAYQDRRTIGTIIEDENIEQKANYRLGMDEELYDSAHISIVSFNNNVLVVGQAPTGKLKGKIDTILKKIPKIQRVYNEVRLSAPSSSLTRASDLWLTSKVKSNLYIAKYVKANRIKVITENGEVFLMGIVTKNEGQKVTEIVRSIGGVQKVIEVFEFL